MLRLEAITAGYETTTVLRDVDLSVPEASVVALLGPNGAGKTTLLRVASGLLVPAEGRVWLDGVPVPDAHPHRRVTRGVCHVPEGLGVFPSLSVRDNIRLFGAGQGEPGLERVIAAFPALQDRLGQEAGTLSGGEQQMLALSRVIVQRPSYVLLDEVSMGLAPQIVDELYAFLTELAAGGTALLLVEQYADRALALADYVYLLSRGRIGFAGEPAELESSDILDHYLATAD